MACSLPLQPVSIPHAGPDFGLRIILRALEAPGAWGADHEQAADSDGFAARAQENLAEVMAAKEGDLEAASRLIQKYHRAIASYVYSIVLNPADLDDVTQMVFVKMCSRVSTLRDARVFEPWLYQLARRVSLDFLRRQKFRKLWCSVEALLFHPAEDHEPVAVRGVGAEEVHEVLKKLNSRDRQLLVLASEGHTYAEIARLLGLSRGSVKARLARVRDQVRHQLSSKFDQ